MTAFIALVVLNERRKQKGKMDCFCCFGSGGKATKATVVFVCNAAAENAATFVAANSIRETKDYSGPGKKFLRFYVDFML